MKATVEKEKIKNLYGLIHPLFGAGPPKYAKKYSKKETEEMLKRYKNLVDRVSSDPNSALIIAPSGSKKEKELFEYAIKKIPKERLLFDSMGSKKDFLKYQKEKEKIQKRVNEKTNLLMCGEMTESCVPTYGMNYMVDFNISEEKARIMPDLSVTWMGKKKQVQANKKGFEDFLKKQKIDIENYTKVWIQTPKTPSKLKKMTIKNKEEILKRIKRETFFNIKMPQTRQQQEKLDMIRGFSTLPRDKWRKTSTSKKVRRRK